MNLICENCGCSHDGTYGSGRFCSLKCCKSYIAKQNTKRSLNLVNTGRTCFKAKGGWKCSHCPLVFRTRREKEKHYKDVHAGERKISKRKISNGLKLHAWNYGLTKDTHPILAQISATIKANIMGGKVKAGWSHIVWTDERRKQQSERKKQFYQEHPECHPNHKLAGNRSKMTYPELITYQWLNDYGFHPIHNFHYRSNKFNRYVDFYIPSIKLFIEVDGEHWHRDIQKDIDKDSDARSNGFITLRLKPKDGISKQLIEYFYELKE